MAESPPKRFFDCSQCPGYCCSHGRIEVTDYDVKRLAQHLGLSERAMRKKYAYHYQAQGVDEWILRHHKDKIYKSVCKFFDRKTRRCTVYEARPNVCRKYPYGSQCGYYYFLKFERAHQYDDDYVPSA